MRRTATLWGATISVTVAVTGAALFAQAPARFGFGRPATPQEIAAYCLNFDSRHIQSNSNPTVWVRAEVVEHANAHQKIIFNRAKLGAGLSQRTFLNSTVAKRLEDNPPT